LKWFNVRNFKPAYAITDCLVRTKGGCVHVAHNFEMNNGSYEWINNDNEEHTIKDVTHFCIIDPIEIENE